MAKVSIVNGGFAPEAGSLDVHIELESGTITGGGSGDIEMEESHDGGLGSKIISEASPMIDREVKIELENEVGHMLSESDNGTQTSERFYILNRFVLIFK